MGWKLSKWNSRFSTNPMLPAMTRNEIASATEYLRSHDYPKPEDCPNTKCPDYRPACKLNICRIAVGMCGDF